VGSHADGELGVLVDADVLPVAADAAGELGPEGTQVDGVDPSRRAAPVEAGRSDAEGRGHGRGDSLLEPAARLRRHGAADDGRAAGVQCVHAPFDVVGGDHAVAVDPHEHLTPRLGEGDVEGRRLDAPGVVDDPHLARPVGGQIPGRVRGATVHDQDLDDLPIALGRHRVEAGVDVGLFVEDGNGHGDGRLGVSHGRPPCTS
jgi:hypothetical protein